MSLFATRCDLESAAKAVDLNSQIDCNLQVVADVVDLVNNREDRRTRSLNRRAYKNKNEIHGFISISDMNPPIADNKISIFS